MVGRLKRILLCISNAHFGARLVTNRNPGTNVRMANHVRPIDAWKREKQWPSQHTPDFITAWGAHFNSPISGLTDA
jgi:hypothetical protein